MEGGAKTSDGNPKTLHLRSTHNPQKYFHLGPAESPPSSRPRDIRAASRERLKQLDCPPVTSITKKYTSTATLEKAQWSEAYGALMVRAPGTFQKRFHPEHGSQSDGSEKQRRNTAGEAGIAR